MASPRLSIVLPTYNRVVTLRGAISALLRQQCARDVYEVIVVDNNCTDGTADWIASLEDPCVRCVHEAQQGLSAARNAGIAAARGNIIAFTDDDVETAPDWVRTIVDALDRTGGVDGVGGRVLPSWTGPKPPWLTKQHWAPLALQDHGDSRRVFDCHSPCGLVGANLAFRRDVFDRIGLFAAEVQRVRDGIGSTEDHELLVRLYAAGGRMLYLPKMLVLARVQPERCNREYHRRWHTGHGRFYAVMRTEDMERSRAQVLGVPVHLLRSAAHDSWEWLRCATTGDWDGAFDAELRLRFVGGFLRERVS